MITIEPTILPLIANIIRNAEEQIGDLVQCTVRLNMTVTVNPLRMEIDVDYIKQTVCEEFKVSWLDITSVTRTGKLSDARQAYCYLCRRLLNRSYVQLGLDLKRNHSTTMYAAEQFTQKMELNDKRIIEPIQRILIKIKNIKG